MGAPGRGGMQSRVCLGQAGRCKEMWLTLGWDWPLDLRNTVFNEFPSGLSFTSRREQNYYSWFLFLCLPVAEPEFEHSTIF